MDKQDKVVDLVGYRYAKEAKAMDHRTDAIKYLVGSFLCAPKMDERSYKIGWVSVEDRLPPNKYEGVGYLVICLSISGEKWIDSSRRMNDGWHDIKEGFVRITHWAYMPGDLP